MPSRSEAPDLPGQPFSCLADQSKRYLGAPFDSRSNGSAASPPNMGGSIRAVSDTFAERCRIQWRVAVLVACLEVCSGREELVDIGRPEGG